MKKLLSVVLFLLLNACSQSSSQSPVDSVQSEKQSAKEVKSNTKQELKIEPPQGNEAVKVGSATELFAQKGHNVWIEDNGIVVKLLKDDNSGARHQKFLVKVNDRITLLIAHNIDLAPRIEDLVVGDKVAFHGQYVYNPKGGVVHWTHLDPNHGHSGGGYILHHEKVYQ